VERPPVVLGLDFGGTKIAVTVCDLQGNRLAVATADTGRDHARTVLKRGITAARGLLSAAAPDSELAAVGAATFGIPHDDRVDLAPTIDGWESLALGRELREAFPAAAVRLATDAKAAAAAECRWGALRGCDPGIYLNLGTGLSAALVTGGQVVTGGNGAAGEIGYNLRTISDVGLDLAGRTMLEEMVSGQALARRAGGQPGRSRQLTAADVFGAGAGDTALRKLVAEFTAELAFHLVNLAILVNPVRIAVGGGLVRSWNQLGPPLQAALSAGVPFPPELVVASFPYDAPLLGAVALAVDAAASRDSTDSRDAAGPPDSPDSRDSSASRDTITPLDVTTPLGTTTPLDTTTDGMRGILINKTGATA
jgi:glucokinase